jgi:hypothetical protein
MMPALTRRARTFWLLISAASYVATFCGFGDRLDAAEVSAVTSITAAPYRSIDPPVESVVRRDPFSGKESSASRGNVDTSATQSMHDAPTDADVTVPDIVPRYGDQIAFDGTKQAEPRALALRATITGPRPVAYVEEGDNLDIVRVSDTVGGRRVAAIDLRGLAFTDGSRLDLSDAFSPTPAPRKPPGSNRTAALTREFQRLRELILSRTNATAEPRPVVGQRSSDAIVTPSPLRTVDANGVPVGTTPTPEAGAPTAYPVPYPYPPRPR